MDDRDWLRKMNSGLRCLRLASQHPTVTVLFQGAPLHSV